VCGHEREREREREREQTRDYEVSSHVIASSVEVFVLFVGV